MVTTIGINITTKTAKEQELLVRERECRAYWQSSYEGSLHKECEKIISKYTDATFDTSADLAFQNDGSVINSIVFEIINLNGFDKESTKKELKAYILGKFSSLFERELS